MERAFQPRLSGHLCPPGVAAERLTTSDAMANGGQFGFSLRLVDALGPQSPSVI
jgi:hypothetical protein